MNERLNGRCRSVTLQTHEVEGHCVFADFGPRNGDDLPPRLSAPRRQCGWTWFAFDGVAPEVVGHGKPVGVSLKYGLQTVKDRPERP